MWLDFFQNFLFTIEGARGGWRLILLSFICVVEGGRASG